MSSDRIMVPDHPLWPNFIEALRRVPLCEGTTAHAQSVLARIPGIDVLGSLDALAELGGSCDCAIEFDVASATARTGS